MLKFHLRSGKWYKMARIEVVLYTFRGVFFSKCVDPPRLLQILKTPPPRLLDTPE